MCLCMYQLLTGVDGEVGPLVARPLNLGHLPAGEVRAQRAVQPLVRRGVVSLGALEFGQQPGWDRSHYHHIHGT